MPKRSRMKRFTRKKKGGSPRKIEIVKKRASSPIPPPKIRLPKFKSKTLKIKKIKMNVEPKKTGKLRNWWNRLRGKKEQPVEQIYEKINPLYTSSSSSPHSKHLRVGSKEENYYIQDHTKKNTPPVYAQLNNSNTSSNTIYEKIDSDSDSNSKKKKSPPPVPAMKQLPPRKGTPEIFNRLKRVVKLRHKSINSKKRKGMVFEDPFLEDVNVDSLVREQKKMNRSNPSSSISLG